MPCGTAGVKTIYGGAKNADVGTETNPANIVLNVYGGDSNLESVFGGNNVGGTIWGGVTVNLYGGMMDKVFGGNNAGGHIKNAIQVNMEEIGGDCALGVNTIYGGGNDAAYSPTDASAISPEVNIKHGTVNNAVYGGGKGSAAVVTALPKVTIGDNNPNHAVLIGANLNGTTTPGEGNVYGGGDAAAVTGNTQVNIVSGEVTHKVVGGGNAAGISGNTEVNISGGTVCTALTDAGVYGGCNMSGTVGGNATLNITGSETSHTIIGTMAALENETPVNVHGGGYGAATDITGNVTVNFGTDEEVNGTHSHCDYPMLYGDLYGGSALGDVNTNGDNTTTVNVLNGSFKSKMKVSGGTVDLFGGNVYGGGLGNADHPAKVYGKVHVNIGAPRVSATADPTGLASFSVYNVEDFIYGSKVFGCNNVNGSPQDEVFVDVYQTAHTPKDMVNYEESDRSYAIANVFGGGNRAHYEPSGSMKAYTYIHYCDNTIDGVYGGGNAADALGVEVNVDGGRFEYVFGGGNGQVIPANIGDGGIELTICAGHVGYKYVGCDVGGNVMGPMHDNECNQNPKICDGELEVDYFFFGANKATIIGGLMDTIYCNGSGDPMHYMNVYAGSRLAVIYGDIYLVVRGGNITNLFGGSRGDYEHPGDVRRYPDIINHPELINTVPADARDAMQTYLHAYPEAVGTGGNIYMKLEGGTIHNVYGGNQLKGDVDGDIIIVVNANQECPLDIDTIYGGNEKAVYEPEHYENGAPRISPQVYLQNGKVNYYVFGGSLGDVENPGGDAGQVTSNPYVVIGDDAVTTHTAIVGKDVFGGGSTADVIGDTKVILRGKATIGGDVYGGSKHGIIDGSTDVQIVPESSVTPTIPAPPTPPKHTLTLAVSPAGYGTVEVTDNQGHAITSGAQVAEGTVLHIVARHEVGHTFNRWEVNNENGYITQSNQASTTFIMGHGDVTLTAIFQ